MAKKRSISSLYIFPILFIVIISSYIYRFIFLSLDIDIIKYGVMESCFETDSLIIRNEWVVNFPPNVQLRNKAEEGHRVYYGEKIVEIIKGEDIKEDLLVKVNKLEERINEITDEDTSSIFEKDDEKLSKTIDDKVELLKRSSIEGDIKTLKQIKNKLSADLYKKSLISGQDSFSGKNLVELKAERDNLKELYDANNDAIYSKSTGVVSYKLDGLEQSLSPLNIESFDLNDIKEIIESFNTENREEGSVDGVKVIEGYSWYICIIINQEQIEGLKEGNKVKIVFKDYENDYINAKIKYISDNQDNENEYLIVFETDEYLKDYYSIRTADIKIITKTNEGFVIPKESIVEVGEEKGIYVIKKGITRFVPINILSYEGDNVLVENVEKDERNDKTNEYTIKVYDEVIKNIKNVKADKRVI